MNNAKIYLCKADSGLLGSITGILPDTCNLTKNVMDLWELTFDVNRYTDADGILVQSDYYDSIDEMMRLYLDTNDTQIFFVIDSEPLVKGDGYQEVKSVTAHSIECELCNIYLKNLKINCGTSDSQEYLACDTDENGSQNYYNVNPYTGLPYEYISLVNYNDPQLSLLHLALQGTGWSVKEGLDNDICSIKKSFQTSDSVYSFLMKTVSPAASVIFEFDRKNKQVGIVKADNYGEDTGIFITMRNLMNSFEVTSTSNDSIITKLTPTGADNLGIEYVNFGQDYITNLDYFMNTLNEYGDYKFVSSELHDKYNAWKDYREKEQISIGFEFDDDTEIIAKGTRREVYTELTKLYNKTISDISELRNRLPNDGCLIDYRTYKLDELKTAYTAYNKALLALITLYKNEYGVTEIDYTSENLTPTPSTATNIKDTPYWYDFYAYKDKIIPAVKEALKMYCETDDNGNLKINPIDGSFIELENGNPDYYKDYNILKEVNSYLYEWSLYGLDELESKKKAWLEAANLLFDECFIFSENSSSSASGKPPITYRTPDETSNTGWKSLSDEQKSRFTTFSAYSNKLNQYLDYMSFNERKNSLTNTSCTGIIRQCEKAIDERTAEISAIEQKQKSYNEERKKLADSVALNEDFRHNSNTSDNGTLINDTDAFFTKTDIDIINSLIKEQNFNNENILITSLDDIVSTVNVQEELYQSAVSKLYEISQPQYSFRTELDNLYSLEEFKAYQKPFDIGNFIRVGLEIHEELYDNNFIKLRLISISYNPLEISESLSVEFSTMTKSLNSISDLTFLLGSEYSSGGSTSSSGGSSGSSSGSTYGNNDANVQISNNMLNALLSTEMFGTAVNDVLLDTIQANKGNFNTLLANSGVFGSLEDGSTIINGECISTGNIKSVNYNGADDNPLENTTGSILQLSDGKFSFGGGKLKWDGDNLSVTGVINATKSNIVESIFIDGDITANKLSADYGTLAGWDFDREGFYNDNVETGIHGEKYIGSNGLLMGDLFSVSNDGFVLKDILYKKSINNYSLNLSNLIELNGNNNINMGHQYPYRIYVHNYKDFDNEQSFYIYISCGAHVHITFTDNSIDDHYLSNLVYKYRIDKENIKNIYDFLDYENSLFIEKINDEIFAKNIGYIDSSDWILIDDNFEEVFEEDIEGFPSVGTYRIADFYMNNGIYQENPMHLNSNNKDDYGHGWSNETVNEKLELLGMCSYSSSAESSKLVYMLSDIEMAATVVGMMLDSFSKKIKIDDTFMTNKGFSSKYIYNNVSVSGKALYINSNGIIGLSSSSERFKNSISNNLTNVSDPHGLYDIDIVQFKYNNNYFSSEYDEGIGKFFIGFIAENVAEKFKDGATFDKDGLPDGWDIRYMFPAALKLIQDQYKDIEKLKEEVKLLKEIINN